jgi:hypothetical protein
VGGKPVACVGRLEWSAVNGPFRRDGLDKSGRVEDEGATPDVAAGLTGITEILKGSADGGLGDSDFPGQAGDRRQSVAGMQFTGADCFLNCIPDLDVEGGVRIFVNTVIDHTNL